MNYLAKLLLCVFISTMYTDIAVANDPVLVNCNKKTPEIYDLSNKPSKFSLSNNLRRKISSPISAEGELIYIVGKVTDTNCMPIRGANVFIWHTNAYGIYQHNPYDNGNMLELIPEELDMYDYQFIGSGKSVTDNLGNYGFITIMPGTNNKNKVPHVHFMLQHSEFPEFNTTMFFPEYDNNQYTKFKEINDTKLQDLLTAQYTTNHLGIKTYHFNITIEGKSPYKSFK
ncbi:dioxygenase [Ehrlichia ruminantium]|uniref:Dioxygenase n=1 Tax=Ehrlichia ruminantium TaxID=779 RepID=A0AAE6QDK7_EHRRU|nr:protocatechuate 3,4-dioxygenase [Ehrlichia ruminantium]QGR02699.1 dioxygenase [Ehrlichia ruminantium]QGR03620.1 dioxygenase [Ehrlichia ruminantium]QGR04547.1 dioxygenase [Ehrlichia ruminantium]